MKSTHAKPIILIPLLCLIGALAGYLVPSPLKAGFITQSAWAVCLILLIGTGYLIAKAYRKSLSVDSLKRNAGILLLSAVVLLVFERVDDRSNKVILDELVIQASALQMLENNTYKTPFFSQNLRNEFSVHEGLPDKRPPLYAFILSSTHRLIGYSSTNGYLLNGLLGFALLVLLGKIGMVYLPRYGGYIAILSFASLPLLSQNITSQHFEVLNLTLIALLLYTCLRVVLQGKQEEIQLAYVLACGIAMTRYEGVLFFLIPFIIHAHSALSKEPQASFKLVYWICPIFTAFIFLLVGYVFANQSFWQLEDLNSDHAFGIQYWLENSAAFLEVMLHTGRSYPGSFPLSMIGLASIPVTGLYAAKGLYKVTRGEGMLKTELLPLMAAGLTLMLFLALIFSYHWGAVNTHLTSRFLLYPYLFLALSALYALKKEPLLLLILTILLSLYGGLLTLILPDASLTFSYVLVVTGFTLLGLLYVKGKKEILPRALILLWSTFLLSETFPAIHQKTYEEAYLPIPRTEIFIEWVKKYADTNSVFIAESPYYGMLEREASTSYDRFRIRPGTLLELQKRNLFSNIFALQEVFLDESGTARPYEKWKLPENVEFELVERKRINSNSGVRMVRITGLAEDTEATPSE